MLMTQLRAATSSCHKQVEQRIDLQNRIASLPEYRRLLTRFYGFYEQIESRLTNRYLDGVIDYEERRKTPLLEYDLSQLGLSNAELAELPRCITLPPLLNAAQTLGCMYVIEGATLGGQIISRILKQHLGLDSLNGGAFFNGCGEETADRWKAFGTVLNAWADTNGEETIIIEAARETFGSLDGWFASETKGESA